MSFITVRHPSCLFVSRLLTHPEKLQFNFPFHPQQMIDSTVRNGRTFCFQRQANEELLVFLQRLSANINSHFTKKRSALRPLSVREVSIVDLKSSSQDSFSTQTPLGQVFFNELDSPRLQLLLTLQLDMNTTISEESVHQMAFDVQLNPATITSCSLDLLPQVGCPFVPCIESSNLCMEKSRFLWMISKSSSKSGSIEWPSEPTHEGYIFIPKPEHVGHFLRLCVLPYDIAGRPGVPFGELDLSSISKKTPQVIPFFGSFLTSKRPICHAPMQALHHSRFQQLSQRAENSNEFRVVSYNLLASMYSRTEAAEKIFFPHCPPRYLAPEYRFPLIFREIVAYNADILCLQEVDTKMFFNYFTPLLRIAGFDGLFLSKLLTHSNSTTIDSIKTENGSKVFPRKAEGVAIFFRSDRLRLKEKLEVDSLIAFAESEHNVDPTLELVFQELQNAASHILWSRSQGLLACVLESITTEKSDDLPKQFVVASAHLYFHPEAVCLRSVQCAAVRRILSKFAHEQSRKISGNGEPLPVILGGDLNCQPDSDSYKILVNFSDDSLPSKFEKSFISSSQFRPAVTFTPNMFTNIVPGYKACIDGILYTNPSGSVKVIREYPLPTDDAIYASLKEAITKDPSITPPLCPDVDGGLSLPNSQFPSDHLPLIVDFRM